VALVIAGCGGGNSGPTAPPDPLNASSTNSAASNTDSGLIEDDPGNTEQVAGPGVALEKATNGFDADTAPGPSIPAGDPVEWTYVVTNIGDVELVSYLVEDDVRGEICRGSSLAAGDSDTCTSSDLAVSGQYANVGTVTASDGSTRVSATDPSHYLGNGGAFTAVQIEKSTNGEDADFPLGPIVLPGSRIDWTYTVTNIGETTLVSWLVTDDQIAGDICRGQDLLPDESVRCTAGPARAIEGQYANIGLVQASDGQIRVSDDDPSHYFGSVPIVEIDKLTDEQESPTLVEGCPVTWTYDVFNRGNIELARIAVTDSEEGPITCPFSSLDVGEDMRCEETGIVGPDDYTNTATVQAVDPAGNRAPDDTDTDGYFVRQEPPDCSTAVPSIDIIWPPNHHMVEVNVVISDVCRRPMAVTILGITQDEPLDAEGDGNFEPDGAGVGTDTAELRAERQGGEDGRVYEISFSAEAGGASCTGAVQVGVPHNNGSTPIDSGQDYDSTGG